MSASVPLPGPESVAGAVRRPLDFAGSDDPVPVFGVAPLVDIVLLLIAFYLLVMKTMDARTDTAIDLPTAQLATAAELAPAELITNLRADGSILINTIPVADADLVPHLATERARAADAGQVLRLVIRADRSQPFGRLDELMTAARDAGIGAIAVRTQTGGP